MNHPAIRLETDELPGGPWIYGRQVAHSPEVVDGALVEVLDRSDRFVGHALYNGRSDIRLRMLNRGKRRALDRPRDFLRDRLASAARLRRKVLRLPEVTDAWRLAHAEGDDLSGLVIDRFADTFVCEFHSLGFWRLREEVTGALLQLDPSARVVHRVPRSAARLEGFEDEELPPEEEGEIWINEHGLGFPVTPGSGHKTGWFCDQRDNRQRVAQLARDRHVLDLCTNAGGFALFAARAGARRVVAVDLDEVALDRASRAAHQARLSVEFRHKDVFDYLRASAGSRRPPELVVLDPHKIISGRAQMDSGRRRYLDMNALAVGAVAPGGLFATFSCSGALELPAFLGIVFQAARRAERGLRLLELFGAAPDHPQRPEFPRSRYLKGALFAVD